jgi:hypothetical protein
MATPYPGRPPRDYEQVTNLRPWSLDLMRDDKAFDEMFHLIRGDLRLRNVPFESAALFNWVAGMLPLFAPDALPADLADDFLKAIRQER